MLRFEAPAPDLCIAARAETGVPLRIERVRATPLVVEGAGDDEGVGDRDGPRGVEPGDKAGSVDGDGRRPAEPGGKGFFVLADIVIMVIIFQNVT